MAWLDPRTGDLVLTRSRDVRRPALPALHHIHLRLVTHRGSCFWDQRFGSTLHELPRLKLTASALQEVESRARLALRPMVDTGEISALRIAATRPERSRVELAISALDDRRRPLTFTLWIPV